MILKAKGTGDIKNRKDANIKIVKGQTIYN
jgi:hypothetical protein